MVERRAFNINEGDTGTSGPEIKPEVEPEVNHLKDFHYLITRSDCEKEERCFRERIFFKQRWNQKIEIRCQVVELVFYQCQNDMYKLQRLLDVLSRVSKLML